MRVFILFIFLSSYYVHGQYDGSVAKLLVRRKRDATGALDILTNHAQPIHADVTNDPAVKKVTPPKDNVFKEKSLRKSLPRRTTLDLTRAVARVITLVVLVFSAVLEFYPLLKRFFNTIYNFLYPY